MLIEIRDRQIRNGKPILVSPRMVSQNGENFRSVFEYPKETAELIKLRGHTADLKQMPVQCSTIFIDVDSNDMVQPVLNRLKQIGIGFYIYSARRGIHIHIPIAPILGVNVPYSVKMWLLSWFEPEEIDMSFYHHSGIYRLIGAVHTKDKSIKKYLSEWRGSLLSVPIVAPILRHYSDKRGLDGEYDARVANITFTRMVRQDARIGNRYPSLFKMVMQGLDAGIRHEVIHRIVQEWNVKHCKPQHTSYYIRQKTEDIIRRY